MNDTEISSSIRWINLILTMMIVAMHSSCGYLVTNSGVDYFFKYINILFDLAVPMFFEVSIFLFFWKNIDSCEDCCKKIRRRVKSILMPYFFYAGVSAIAYYGMIIIYSYITTNADLTFTAAVFFADIMTAKYDPPIWFLKTLFELQLMACALFFIVKKRRNVYLVLSVLTFALNFYCDFGYSSPLFWLPIMCLGIWFAFSTEYLSFNYNFIYCISAIIALVFFPFQIILYSVDPYSKLYYSYRIVGSVLFGSLLLRMRLDRINLPIISDFSFFVFVLHVPVLSVVRKVLWMLFENFGVLGCIITYLLTVIVTVCFICCLGYNIENRFPVLWGILNGNR